MIFVIDVLSLRMDSLRYLSWIRLIRVTVWVMRFVVKLLVKVRKVEKFLGVEVCIEVTLISIELDRVGKFWVK